MATDNTVDFDVAMAKSWNTEVFMELQQVEQVLNEVSEICNTHVGEEDSIVSAIEDAGKTMKSKWDSLTDGFAKMWEKFTELITGREQSINKVTDSINQYKNNFTLEG